MAKKKKNKTIHLEDLVNNIHTKDLKIQNHPRDLKLEKLKILIPCGCGTMYAAVIDELNIPPHEVYDESTSTFKNMIDIPCPLCGNVREVELPKQGLDFE